MQARKLKEQFRKPPYRTKESSTKRTETMKWKKPPVASLKKVRQERKPQPSPLTVEPTTCKESPPSHTADMQDVREEKTPQAFRDRGQKTQMCVKQRMRKQDSFRCPVPETGSWQTGGKREYRHPECRPQAKHQSHRRMEGRALSGKAQGVHLLKTRAQTKKRRPALKK